MLCMEVISFCSLDQEVFQYDLCSKILLVKVISNSSSYAIQSFIVNFVLVRNNVFIKLIDMSQFQVVLSFSSVTLENRYSEQLRCFVRLSKAAQIPHHISSFQGFNSFLQAFVSFRSTQMFRLQLCTKVITVPKENNNNKCLDQAFGSQTYIMNPCLSFSIFVFI